MKICVIGNSQVGALLSGYKLLPEIKVHADFVGIIGGGGPCLEVENGTIVVPEKAQLSSEVAGLDRLDLGEYDAVLLSGVGSYAMRKNLKTFSSMVHVHEFISDDKISQCEYVVTKSLYKNALKDHVRVLNCNLNIVRVRSIFNGHIFLQMFPMPTPGVLDQLDFPFVYEKEELGHFLIWYNQILSNECSIIAEENNATLISYSDLFFKNGFTQSKYSTADAWHMNPLFGKLFWEQFTRLYL